jgi:copper chaperone CopZ
MKKIFILMIVFFCAKANYAQFGKDLLDRAKQSAKRKTDQKIDQTIDKGMDKTDDIGKKKKKKKGSEPTTETGSNETAEASTNTTAPATGGIAIGEGSETIIQTNITCAAGKKKTEAALKKQDGVFEAAVDIANGELTIRYSSDGTSYTTLIEIINKLGFEADGKKGTGSNPCK